jgi:TetR/AcrR family transcriptional repressor of nem operon
MPAVSDMRDKILAAARLTVQAHGYTGLSFRELAKDVGIKSASIHYYFPSKGDLGGVLAERYTADFAAYLDGLLNDGIDPVTCIKLYTDVFRTTLLNENRMCLGGIMAAEYDEVPAEVRVEVVRFGEMNVRWLAQVLALLKPPASPETIERRALGIFTAIAGAQLVARSRRDVGAYDDAVAAYRNAGLLP